MFETANKETSTRLGPIGVVAPTTTPDIVAAICDALIADGIGDAYAISTEGTAPSDRPATRLFLRVDSAVGRLLAGATRPRLSTPRTPQTKLLSLAVPCAEDLKVLASLHLQTLIVVGGGPLSPDIETYVKGKIYRLRIGNEFGAEGCGPLEISPECPTATLRLEVVGDGGPSVVSEMYVQSHRVSTSRTWDNVLANVGDFVTLALSAPLRGLPVDGLKPVESRGPRRTGGIDYATRTTALALAVGRRALFRDQWFLAVCRRSDDGMPLPPYGGIRLLIPRLDRFWADPFVVEREGRAWLFFEEAFFASDKGASIGHISVAPIGEEGFLESPAVALDLPWHLSYPFVFENEGEWYMVPESASQRRLDVFRCVQWPNRWERCQTLLEKVPYVDASLAHIGDLWWLFAARGSAGASSADFLDLYHARSPLGPWTLHRRSPVVMDARSARPAGRPFEWRGDWYRPVQDSSGGIYGRAIRLQRILRLTEDDYSETTVHTIEPTWTRGIYATHTINTTRTLVVLDACRRVPRMSIPRWHSP